MSEETKGTVPATVGVLGGGRMGAGIAHAFLISGAKVTVVEANAQAAQGAAKRSPYSSTRVGTTPRPAAASRTPSSPSTIRVTSPRPARAGSATT